MYFKDIIGQESVKSRLILSANQGIVPHAQLFSEPSGAGAFPLALAYARYLNCKHRSATDSCGTCSSCKKFDQLVHPDIHFVFPIILSKEKKKEICDDYLPEWRQFVSENPYFDIDKWVNYMGTHSTQALIPVKEASEIISKLSLKPLEAAYRCVLIWMPEKMNEESSNRLLKLIEEPPINTIFLLITENPDQIISTIISRTQRISIRGIEKDAIAEAMESKYALSAQDAIQVASMSQGSMIKAMEMISLNEEKAFYLDLFISMMRNSWTKNVKGMKEAAETFASLGKEKQKNFFAYAQHMIRENFIYNIGNPSLIALNQNESTFSTKFAPYVNERNVEDLVSELELAERHVTQNVNPRFVFFDISLKITVLLKR